MSESVCIGERSSSFRSVSDSLTPREQEVVKLIAEGASSNEIAEALGSARRPWSATRVNIIEKLDMRGRVELARYAIRRALIEP